MGLILCLLLLCLLCSIVRRFNMISLSQQYLRPLLHETSLFDLYPLFLLLLFYVIYSLKFTRSGSGGRLKNLPPSPPKLPIVGNLHQLGTLPHSSLSVLSKKYGPIMLLHLGQTPTLVVSSAEMAREVMKTQDVVFADRPKLTAAEIFLNGCTDIAFAPYGEYWRQMRKVAVVELLSLQRVQSLQYVRDEEVDIMVNNIRRLCQDAASSSINLTDLLLAVTNNVVSRALLGQRSEEEGGDNRFGEVSRRVMLQFTSFSFRDYFPSLAWVDELTGLITKLKKTTRDLHDHFDKVIEQHEKKLSQNQKNDDSDKKDFVDILLQLQKSGMIEIDLTKNDLKAILVDMFVGGSDTSSTTMEWVMAELMRKPSVMKKAQEEVRRVVGKKSKVEEDDLTQMEYLKCVVKETLRLHPPLALLLPRETRSNLISNLGGFDIPPKTKVLINAWAIQRDPEQWDRPEVFLPERFDGSLVDFKGQDFQFVPFGSGRRGCPGMSFGVATIELILASLLYWFDWKMPAGMGPEDMDMGEIYGLTVNKKAPLFVVPVLHHP